MAHTRTLSTDLAIKKCRMGQRERCCAFLVMGATGFECVYGAEGFSAQIELRRSAGQMTARAGPCKDPHDNVSAPQE